MKKPSNCKCTELSRGVFYCSWSHFFYLWEEGCFLSFCLKWRSLTLNKDHYWQWSTPTAVSARERERFVCRGMISIYNSTTLKIIIQALSLHHNQWDVCIFGWKENVVIADQMFFWWDWSLLFVSLPGSDGDCWADHHGHGERGTR